MALSSSPSVIEIVITFNPALEVEDQALSLARRLFANLDTAIDTLTLVPSDDEELAVHLNGQLVHSQSQSGRAPRVADVLALLRATGQWPAR